ncbi:methyltransferase [Caulobacter sp. DWR1-3-2b1]|uniref:methyltransferase n=1 Tax=Caulobacter sp. DWR1-3-2b1 TaxID=2804670 RepID=UPI003CFAC730
MTTEPLAELLKALAARNYRFITPTPSTCRRMAGKALTGRPDLRDIFGWSRAFAQCDLDPALWALLDQAGALTWDASGWRSRFRVSTVHERLFLHSAFPANTADAIFLGPDSYRFADLIAAGLATGGHVRSILDIGTGAGVGGLVAERYAPGAKVLLSDVNPAALDLARVNASHAHADFEVREASGLEGALMDLDLIVANPPYVAGQSGRTYKDGGDMHGARLSLDWATAGMAHLAPGGRFILYTGSTILDGGSDPLREALEEAVAKTDYQLGYRELDPDIFSRELRGEAYAAAERIAAVAAVITRPS